MSTEIEAAKVTTADSGKKGLIVRIRDYFGMKPGQTLAEFSAEVKSLTEADKAWLRSEFERMGLGTI